MQRNYQKYSKQNQMKAECATVQRRRYGTSIRERSKKETAKEFRFLKELYLRQQGGSNRATFTVRKTSKRSRC